MDSNNNFQRVGSTSNAHVGRDFEDKAKLVLASNNIVVRPNFSLEIGICDLTKPHTFDLGSDTPQTVVECKSHRWTAGDKVPSAKMTVWNEAMYYFYLVPVEYRKIMFVLKDVSMKRCLSLAEYYLKTYRHLIPPSVEFWERDGRLVVVSKDLSTCVDASTIAPTLQAALDDWRICAPKLEALAEQLQIGSVPTERFHEAECESPLPRAYQWADGSAYINHVELVRKARGAEVPASFYEDPLMYQGVSGPNLGPRDPIPFVDPEWGYDMEAEVCVITDDVPMGVSEGADPFTYACGL